MRRQFSCLALVSAAVLLTGVGCRPQQPFYFSQAGKMDHYVGVAQQIEYPDLETVSLDEVNGAKAPLTLDNPKPESYWDLGLEETFRIALANSTVIRSLGGVQFGPSGSFGNPSAILQSPVNIQTIYNPALQETTPAGAAGQGPGQGIEAALSEFDAGLSGNMFWGKAIAPQNTAGTQAAFRPNPYKDDTANAQVRIEKTAATGDRFSVIHDMNYNMDNTPLFFPEGSTSPFKRWANGYSTDLIFQWQHPFLRGSGVGVNRIAGPSFFGGTTLREPGGVSRIDGVVIARIHADQSLADFEAAVRNLVNDIERAYWNLYFAYRRLDSVVAGRDAALQSWRQAKARYDVGGAGGSAKDEAQARDNYLLFKGTVEEAQSNLYKTENILRYMMGLTHSDGRLIRPSDEPIKAKVEFDWYDAHAEALTRSVEIRRQKWAVKEKELALVAYKNLLLPRLDGVAQYGWNGIGDLMIDPSRSLQPQDPSLPFDPVTNPNVPHSAYGSLTTGSFPTWQLGLQFQMMIGSRREMSAVRYAQLLLTRERKLLQEQELEISHQLADAFRDLAQQYTVSQTNYNRWLAAGREVEAVDAAYKAGTTTWDQVLDAQRRKAEAENAYYRTLVDYTLAISFVHFKKGSLLEYDGVFLAEGMWPAKAYFDARRRAIHRDASHFINYGFTQPRIVSQGPYQQQAGEMAPQGEMPMEAPLPVEQPKVMGPEAIGTPTPVPVEQPPATSSPKGAKTESSSVTPRPGTSGQGVRVVAAARAGQNKSPVSKSSDPAAKDSQEMVAKAAPAVNAPAATTSSQVSAASYQQAAQALAPAVPSGRVGSESQPTKASAPPTKPTGMWKSTLRSTKTNEPVANPSPAASDSTPSGWKDPQH